MSDYWTTIGEIAQVFDGPHATPKKIEDGPYFLSISSLEKGALDLSKSAHLSEEDFLKWTKRVTPGKGDILFSYETRLGDAALMPEGIVACLGRRMGLLRPNREKVIPEYLLYAYLSPLFQETIRANTNHGATVNRIALKEMPDFPIRIPTLEEQEKVVSALKSLDKKIQLNRQTNQTLEHIAQAIFKCWFVDFEPTRAKIVAKQTGQDPELAAMAAISGKSLEELDQLSAEQQEQLKITAALFPDALVDSELGEIPEGWREGCVGDVALAKGGYAFKGKSFVEKGNPVVKIKNITGDGRVDLNGAVCIDDEQARSTDRFKLNDGNLLMAMTGATVGKIGFVVTEGQSVYLNQRVAKFESDQFGEKIAWFLFCCFERDSVFDAVAGAAQGSAQPNISSTGIESTKLILASDELIELFCSYTDSLFKKWLDSINENAVLEASRDALLPRLLSGGLSLSGIQKVAVNG